MKELKNIIICGLGAIGSIYAEKFFEYESKNLYILADEKRIARYKKSPLSFNGKTYDYTYITPEKNDIKADLIIISTKNSGLNEALKNLKNFVNDDTIIMSLLNGISSEETVASFYGADKILYSYFVGHTSSRNGSDVTFDGVGKIVFGELKNQIYSEKVESVKSLFDRANIDYEIPEDMQYSFWKKFLVNVGTNQASAVLRGAYKLFQNSEKSLDIAVSLMKEAQAAAKAEGVQNTDKMLDEALDIIHSMLPETKSSMLQDVEAKRKTEVEIFAGKVVELGKKHNFPVPYNEMFLKLISALDDGLLL